jgi:hypothetical protein
MRPSIRKKLDLSNFSNHAHVTHGRLAQGEYKETCSKCQWHGSRGASYAQVHRTTRVTGHRRGRTS